MLTASAVAVTSPAQEELIAAYAPHLMLREQTDDQNCNTREEQYSPPTTVDTVLGNPAVKLVHFTGGKDVPIKKGPTAADIAGLGDDYYLDLPGDPLNVRCPRKGSYATDFQELRASGRAPAITYAHIATEPGHTGLRRPVLVLLLLQPVQRRPRGRLGGDADLLRCATRPPRLSPQGPSQIALFQHAGGERADWGDGEGPEGRHASDRLSRPPALTRPSSTTRSTSRTARTARASAATTPRSRCVESDPRPEHHPDGCRARERVPVAQLPGPLGAAREGLQQRPAGADHQDAVAPAVHLDGRDPPGQPEAAGRGRARPGREHGLLRGHRGRLRVHQPRGEEHASARSGWGSPCSC